MNALRALLIAAVSLVCLVANAYAIGPGEVFQPNAADAQAVIGSIEAFVATPEDDTVGAATNLILQFMFANDSLQNHTHLEIDFPAGFQIDAISTIHYTDSDTLALDFNIEEFSVTGQHLSIELDSLEDLPDAGSTHTITINGLTNPTQSDDYEVVLTILTDDDRILALPAWSGSFALYPGPLAAFNILPEGIQQARAGTTLKFEVETADQYGNEVIIGQVSWSLMGVPQVTGIIDQDGNFQAQHTGASRVIAAYEELADTTSLVYVLPGEFAYFGFTGGPDSVSAGQSWQNGVDDITVTAFDLFGNINYEYEGDFYFEATDPLAMLPATESNQESFVLADEGRKTIPAAGFKLYTAGRHTLRLMQAGTSKAVITPIAVFASSPANYLATFPNTVTAGADFDISVTDAIDSWGNPVSGQAVVTITAGGGNSPSGASPSIPIIAVIAGGGSGVGKLVRAGETSLQISLGGIQTATSIVVLPEAADRIDFASDPVQPIGQPFAGIAKLTVIDEFGNIVKDHSAELDAVVITSSGSGQVLNSVINSAAAFVDGVADLTALGVGYDGNELYVQFTATSESGLVGISPQVAMSSVKITAARVLQNRRYVGEDFSADVTISNFGGESVSVQQLRLYADESQLTGVTVAPGLPATINPLQSQNFTLTVAVPNQPGETLNVSVLLTALVSGKTINDSTAVGELEVLAATGISAKGNTLSPNLVNSERDYSFQLVLMNENTDALQLSAESALIFDFGSAGEYRTQLTSPVTVDGQSELPLTFLSGTIPASAAATYQASLELTGALGTLAYDATIEVADQLTVETPPQLSYDAESLLPSAVYRGREVEFTLDVENSGTGTLDIDPDVSRLVLFAQTRQLAADLLTEQIAGAPALTSLAFEEIFVPSDFPGAIDSLILIVRGESNGHTESFRIKLPQNDITVPGGAAVRLTGTSVVAPNAPFVNLLQQFSVEVTISNTGAESLEDIAVTLATNGASTFDGRIDIVQLGVDTDTTVAFVIEAAGISSISELFTAAIQSASGSESRLPATIESATNPSRTVVVQTPANLNLTSQIDSPPQAQDGRVELGESFIIAASVVNSGQGSVGSGTVALNLIAGGFVVDSPLQQTFIIGEKLQWGITAPADADTARFEIRIIDDPSQTNIPQPARVSNRADTIEVISAVQQVVIGVDFAATGPQLVSPGESYNILDLTFDLVGFDQRPYLEYIQLGILDRNGDQAPASAAIQSASIQYNDLAPITALTEGDLLRFSLGASTGLPERASIDIDIMELPELSDFTLFLDSASFSGRYQSAAGVREVPVIARFANQLLIEQQYTLVAKQLESSFFSYPNPFSPVREQATIVFNLENPQPSTLTIYTLTGDEVLKVDLAAPASSSEPVTYQWDGRNEAGQIVLNGVYLAILEVQNVGEVRTKIAVMK